MHTAHAPRAPAAITATNVTDALDHVERVPDTFERDEWSVQRRALLRDAEGIVRDEGSTHPC